MIQAPIKIKDKKDSEYIFRTPNFDEAQLILDSMVEIAASSPYILSTPESFRTRSLDLQIKWIKESEKSDVSIIIGAYDKSGKIIGFCNGSSYNDVKRKHRAALGVSIHPDYRGLGLGKRLMEVLIDNMKLFSGNKIIELDVMTENIPAIKMYESLGFKHGGIFPKAFILPDGKVIDNLTMYMEI
ncbi:MAG: GNAT family N-acetyltransferase [Bdellovibrionaceae bacterium]|nr:GNAT family N-acetyltransferase [Pseudobdellovibrionaceae bacterium]